MPTGQYPRVKRDKWTLCHETQTKVCRRCLERKSLSDFSSWLARGTTPCWNSKCKPCDSIVNREYAKTYRPTTEQTKRHNDKRKDRPGYLEQSRTAARLRGARMRADGQHTSPEVKAIYRQAVAEQALIQCCPVFDLIELGKQLHVDHIIPLSRGGRHVIDNLQILAVGLNLRKKNKMPKVAAHAV